MSYSTAVPSSMLVIDDSNWQQFVAPTIDGAPAGRGYVPRDLAAFPYGRCAAAPAFDLPLLTIADAVEQWRQKEEQRATLRHLLDRAGKSIAVKHQGSTPLCWAYAPVGAVEINRAFQGEPYLALSPASVSSLANNFQLRGGWGMDALNVLIEHGACPEAVWPGRAVDRRYDTSASRAARKPYLALEWADLATYQQDWTLSQRQVATCVVNNMPVSVGANWWGHQFLIVGLHVENGQLAGWLIRNSWGATWSDGGYGILRGTRMRFEDGQVLRTTTPSQAA